VLLLLQVACGLGVCLVGSFALRTRLSPLLCSQRGRLVWRWWKWRMLGFLPAYVPMVSRTGREKDSAWLLGMFAYGRGKRTWSGGVTVISTYGGHQNGDISISPSSPQPVPTEV
jgi:hypothetical protein